MGEDADGVKVEEGEMEVVVDKGSSNETTKGDDEECKKETNDGEGQKKVECK